MKTFYALGLNIFVLACPTQILLYFHKIKLNFLLYFEKITNFSMKIQSCLAWLPKTFPLFNQKKTVNITCFSQKCTKIRMLICNCFTHLSLPMQKLAGKWLITFVSQIRPAMKFLQWNVFSPTKYFDASFLFSS